MKLDADQENALAEAYAAGKEKLGVACATTEDAFDAMIEHVSQLGLRDLDPPRIAKFTAATLAYCLMAMTPESWAEFYAAAKNMRTMVDAEKNGAPS